jgi:endo-1,4-beta-xylanase
MHLSRRHFLKSAGIGAALSAAAPYVSAARQVASVGADSDVLRQAERRIQEHRKGTVTLRLTDPNGQPLPPEVRVTLTQTQHKFLFGCNIFKLGRCQTPEQNAAYEKRFSGLLNFATLPFYWWTYERQKGQPQDERTDAVARWCRAHQITMKGHPLAWNWRDPPWLAGTPEEVMQLQLERIDRCVRRFKGRIDIWDVVNEATHYDRDTAKRDAPRLTEAIAKMGVGNYVRKAFETARQANPKATLLINDYRTDAAYADKVISQLVDADDRPLYDVIGIQSHMHGGYWGAARTWEVCERFAQFGRPLHFTETTVVSGPKQDATWTTTPEGERLQAAHVTEFYTVLFSHPSVEAITWWDFTDQNAWQSAPAGLLRNDLTPKPAYEQLHHLIKNKWWTQTQVVTAANGFATFEGFRGRYRAEVPSRRGRLTGQFNLDASSRSPISVRLG